jgi:hypothetical protein
MLFFAEYISSIFNSFHLRRIQVGSVEVKRKKGCHIVRKMHMEVSKELSKVISNLT